MFALQLWEAALNLYNPCQKSCLVHDGEVRLADQLAYPSGEIQARERPCLKTTTPKDHRSGLSFDPYIHAYTPCYMRTFVHTNTHPRRLSPLNSTSTPNTPNFLIICFLIFPPVSVSFKTWMSNPTTALVYMTSHVILGLHFLYFFNLLFYFMCMIVLSTCVCVSHVFLVPTEARGGHGFPENRCCKV